jgi:cobalt-zinc-cadmium efflux system membrane fusion protein
MKKTFCLLALTAAVLFLAGCASNGAPDTKAMAPPSANVVEEPDLNIVKVDHPERFKIVEAGSTEERPQINTVGTINPDIDKSVPVTSLAAGRVVGIHAKLGDDVKKGQLLLEILSNDITNAFQTYHQAVADEALAKKQLERAKLLYEHGAMSLNDLQVSEDTEEKARVAAASAAQAIRTLGGDPSLEDPVVKIYAPVSGTIVEQNVTQSASVHTPDNQPNLFTIANLSTVWVLCDVYENDLASVRLGDIADVELNAYPGQVFHGRISNIGKILDPNIRTAKIRIDLANPGMMRANMFVKATFYGLHGKVYATVPSGSVLHLHDRDWVFVPSANGQFRRTEVQGGKFIEGQQVILSGIAPGQRVVNDALALSAEGEQ